MNTKEPNLTEVVLLFIKRFQNDGTVYKFTNGCCYWFAHILCTRFPSATMMYNQVENHFTAKIDGRLFDITGDVTDQFKTGAEPWAKLNDSLLRQRIINYCIEFTK